MGCGWSSVVSFQPRPDRLDHDHDHDLDSSLETVGAAVQAEVLKGLDFLFCADRSLVESTVQVLYCTVVPAVPVARPMTRFGRASSATLAEPCRCYSQDGELRGLLL